MTNDQREDRVRWLRHCLGWFAAWAIVALLAIIKLASGNEMSWWLVFAPAWCRFAVGCLSVAIVVPGYLWHAAIND